MGRARGSPTRADATASRNTSAGSLAIETGGWRCTSPPSDTMPDASGRAGGQRFTERRSWNAHRASSTQSRSRATVARRIIIAPADFSPSTSATASWSSSRIVSSLWPVTRCSATRTSSSTSSARSTTARSSAWNRSAAASSQPTVAESRKPPRPSFRSGSSMNATSPDASCRDVVLARSTCNQSSRLLRHAAHDAVVQCLTHGCIAGERANIEQRGDRVEIVVVGSSLPSARPHGVAESKARVPDRVPEPAQQLGVGFAAAVVHEHHVEIAVRCQQPAAVATHCEQAQPVATTAHRRHRLGEHVGQPRVDGGGPRIAIGTSTKVRVGDQRGADVVDHRAIVAHDTSTTTGHPGRSHRAAVDHLSTLVRCGDGPRSD